MTIERFVKDTNKSKTDWSKCFQAAFCVKLRCFLSVFVFFLLYHRQKASVQFWGLQLRRFDLKSCAWHSAFLAFDSQCSPIGSRYSPHLAAVTLQSVPHTKTDPFSGSVSSIINISLIGMLIFSATTAARAENQFSPVIFFTITATISLTPQFARTDATATPVSASISEIIAFATPLYALYSAR